MKKQLLSILLFLISLNLFSQNFISDKKEVNSFPFSYSICIDANDDWLVNKSATLLQNDIEAVTGNKPELNSGLQKLSKNIIVIGTLRSSIIDQLIKEKKINVNDIN